MTNTPELLLEEIKSILPQFSREIDGKRKPWPKSIRERVLILCDLGYPKKKLSEEIGISYATILDWRRAAGQIINKRRPKKKGFHELSLKTATVIPPQTLTSTTVLPFEKLVVSFKSGLKVEVNTINEVISLLKALGVKNAL